MFAAGDLETIQRSTDIWNTNFRFTGDDKYLQKKSRWEVMKNNPKIRLEVYG